ncbi:hypothetical protein ACQZ4X_04540 [Agrobacterium vitis]
MAVIHHSFRCSVVHTLEREVQECLSLWENGDRDGLADIALSKFAALIERQDLHAAFYLSPEGPVPSWLLPQYISPLLSAFLALAPDLQPITSLSDSKDTNHHHLEKNLPALGWTQQDISRLVHGAPFETMLESRFGAPANLPKGGFRHTGGWLPPGTAKAFQQRLSASALRQSTPESKYALHVLNETGALDDARTMLACLEYEDWLVTTVTH